MKKIVAYSLWGTDPKYTQGAVINAVQVGQFYPGWQARFYCAASVPPDIIEQLRAAGAEVITMPSEGDHKSKFWRFFALDSDDVERVIIRDTDSRLSRREAAAVQEWERSGCAGHIMRDHPCHNSLILGGMWGCRTGVLPNMHKAAEQFNPADLYSQDQLFLGLHVYPLLKKHGICVHDDFRRFEWNSRPFPVPREKDYSFVGEIYNADGTRADDWKILRDHCNSLKTRLRFRWTHAKQKIARLFGKADETI